jgi:bifunctional DNA-binding transcriptional regulator/antitoxin component of YhaV-PrlF toxin-antitoxin module
MTEIRKLTRVGKRSICVVIPAEFVEEMGWRERQKVVLEKKGKTVVVKDWKKK